MSTSTRGESDHRAVELFERCARVAARKTGDPATIYRFEREATEEIVLDAAVRFWTRRGYVMPRDGRQALEKTLEFSVDRTRLHP